MRKILKIMIVDDDLMIIRFLKEILEPDYQTAVAQTGEEALELLDEFRPEIILMDVMMPGIDGYETCQRIREKQGDRDVKILFLSAKTTLEERLRGYSAGGDDYITKPFEMAELLAKIDVFSKMWHENAVPTGEDILDSKQLEILYLIQHQVPNILFIQSKSPYCEIVKEPGEAPMERVRIPVQVIEDFFNGKKMIRVHRSYLVNPQKVVAFEKQINNEYKLLLQDNAHNLITLPVGRTYHEKLKTIMPNLFYN